MRQSAGGPLTGRWWGAAVVALALSGVVAGAHADALVDRAQALQQQGQHAEAFALLDAQEADRAGDPAFDKALAQVAEGVGLYTRALLAWERALQAQPGDEQAQDAVARMLQVLGDWRALQALPPQVRQRSAAVGAALEMDQFLYSYDRLGSGGKSSLHGAFDIGVGRDSNVNAGLDPNGNYPSLPGVPAWTVDPAAWEHSSAYLSGALTLRGRYVLSPQWSVVGGLYSEARHYGGDASRDEPFMADAQLGMAWRANRHEWMVTARGIHETRDGSRVRGTGGLQGEWIYRVDGLNQFGAFLQSLQLHYPGQSVRDVRRTVAGVNHAVVLRSGSLFYLGAYGGEEAPRQTGAGDLGHHLLGVRLGGQWVLHPRWSLFGSMDTERRRFGADDPFFLLRRKDTQWRAVLGVSWVPAPQWRVAPQVEWVDVRSSVPIHPYRRSVFSLVVRREF